MKSKKIVISGYYGYGNLGDEAILESMIKSFKDFLNPQDIVVLSNDFEKTLRLGTKSVSSRSFLKNIQTLMNSDLFISGGGGLTNDIKYFSFLVYISRILLASLFSKKSMIYAQGIGPIERNINRTLCKIVLNRVNLITVRDEESKDLLENIGVIKPIYVTADPVFALQWSENIEFKENLPIIRNNKKSVVIVIRPTMVTNLLDFKKAIATLTDYLIEKGWNVYFMPFQIVYDNEIIFEVLELMNLKENVNILSGYSVQETMEIIKQMDLVIGMRLHSLIFACMMGTPFIGLVYDVKVNSFLKLINQEEYALDIHSIRFDELIDKFELVCSKRPLIKSKLISSRSVLKNKALKNVKFMKELLLEQ